MHYKPSEPFVSSYVHHCGECWNVSTILRQCSSAARSDMYYETLVWKYDCETMGRGDLVHQDEGLDAHFVVCKRIAIAGPFWDKESEE
jgi:hypothetical protein